MDIVSFFELFKILRRTPVPPWRRHRFHQINVLFFVGTGGRELTTNEIDQINKEQQTAKDLKDLQVALLKAQEAAAKAADMARQAEEWARKAGEEAREALRQFEEAERLRKEREDREKEEKQKEEEDTNGT